MEVFLLALVLSLLIGNVLSFKSRFSIKNKIELTYLKARKIDANPVVIEIITRREVATPSKQAAKKASNGAKQSDQTKQRLGVYREQKDTMIEKVIDSPISSVISFVLNPSVLLLAIYFSSIGWSQVLWLQVSFNMSSLVAVNNLCN